MMSTCMYTLNNHLKFATALPLFTMCCYEAVADAADRSVHRAPIALIAAASLEFISEYFERYLNMNNIIKAF